GRAVLRVQPAEAVERGQLAVTLAEALHAPALLVDADQLRTRRCLTDRRTQLHHLGPRAEVALEQDHAGTGVVLQPVALLGTKFHAGKADHEHPRVSFTCAVAHRGIVADGRPGWHSGTARRRSDAAAVRPAGRVIPGVAGWGRRAGLAQRLREQFRRLRALHRVAAVDDEGGHRTDAHGLRLRHLGA